MRIRGFEKISKYADEKFPLPERKTRQSAGYDIAAAEDTALPPGKVVPVPTGIKAYMGKDEYLGIHVRSGFSVRNGVSCVNSQGIIDSDYYNNEENEGHIFIALINHGKETVKIPKGTRIAQGIFYKYLTADGDEAEKGAQRSGGFGSTGM